MEEISEDAIGEGDIIMLGNGKKYLLIQKVKQCFLAVGVAGGRPDGYYYFFEVCKDSQGGICIKIKEDLGKI